MVARMAGIFFISAATLLLEVTLTRLFSLAFWYHFAFMAVGLALLGFGASGTALAMFPALRREPHWTAFWSALLFGPSPLVALLALNVVPFDAYRIAVEPVQVLFLAFQFLALVLPFFWSGLCTGVLLAEEPRRAGLLYGSSLAGSGVGALLAVPFLGSVGGQGALALAGAMGPAAGLLFSRRSLAGRAGAGAIALALLLLVRPVTGWEVRLSPYKALSQALQVPGAKRVWTQWSVLGRVDVVESPTIRYAPGLSYLYAPGPPPQLGVTRDGENLLGIVPSGLRAGEFTEYLPSSVAYRLRRGRVLVLNMGGGLEVLSALHHGAREVVAVEPDAHVAHAVWEFGGGILQDPRVEVVVEHARTFIRRTPLAFDVIQLPLSEGFQVVASGATSLVESYMYTVEAFQDYYRRLAPGGFLVVTRWLQLPPSEELRAWTTAVEALIELEVPHPERHLAALRSMNTATILVKRGELVREEIEEIRAFAVSRRFDLIYLPGIVPEEANRFYRLPGNEYYTTFASVLGPQRETFIRGYLFDVRAPSDDRPFFFHFFRWRQVPTVLALWGRTWQPFGGGGYLILLALLGLATAASFVLILLPLLGFPAQRDRGEEAWRIAAVFFLLGIGFLFVEVPLIQQLILYLGSPTYSMALVVGTLLVASGMGSLSSPRLERWWPRTMVLLVAAVAGTGAFLPRLLSATLGALFPIRAVLAVASLALTGFLMGLPFATLVRQLGARVPSLVPWAWAINGCSSVVSAFLAALLALSTGFTAILWMGAGAYLTAWLLVTSQANASRGGRTGPGRGW
jgi:spermidine synthase